MLRVPGSHKDLLYAKASGADIRIVYSPLDAVKIAERETEKKVILFAIGFETTAPANALALMYAKNKQLRNFFMLSSHMIVLPAVELILSSTVSKVQGLLAPGHVCTITGVEGFTGLSMKYSVPVAVTGFEPVDILRGILCVVTMLENKKNGLINQYSRSVREEGNLHSQNLIKEIFDVADSLWRGIGAIPKSGLKLKSEYALYDAEKAFSFDEEIKKESSACIAGQVLQGIKKPNECSAFGTLCTPLKPLGAPMVSSEGACLAYFNYKKNTLRAK
jgi:hydrogenase expression/formation protein HypD